MEEPVDLEVERVRAVVAKMKFSASACVGSGPRDGHLIVWLVQRRAPTAGAGPGCCLLSGRGRCRSFPRPDRSAGRVATQARWTTAERR